MLSGSWDHTAKLFDVRSGQCEATLRGHTGNVNQAVFAEKDPLRVVTASADKTLKVWDLRRPDTELATLKDHTDSVLCCAVRGFAAASGSDDETLRTWLLPQ